MLNLVLALSLQAFPSAHLLQPEELALAAFPQTTVRLTIREMTEAAVHVDATEPTGWSGERGTKRIIGISLIATGGVLLVVSLVLFGTGAVLPDPRFATTGINSTPYVVGGFMTLVGAGLGLGFGIPLLVQSFKRTEASVTPTPKPVESPRAPASPKRKPNSV